MRRQKPSFRIFALLYIREINSRFIYTVRNMDMLSMSCDKKNISWNSESLKIYINMLLMNRNVKNVFLRIGTQILVILLSRFESMV